MFFYFYFFTSFSTSVDTMNHQFQWYIWSEIIESRYEIKLLENKGHVGGPLTFEAIISFAWHYHSQLFSTTKKGPKWTLWDPRPFPHLPPPLSTNNKFPRPPLHKNYPFTNSSFKPNPIQDVFYIFYTLNLSMLRFFI